MSDHRFLSLVSFGVLTLMVIVSFFAKQTPLYAQFELVGTVAGVGAVLPVASSAVAPAVRTSVTFDTVPDGVYVAPPAETRSQPEIVAPVETETADAPTHVEESSDTVHPAAVPEPAQETEPVAPAPNSVALERDIVQDNFELALAEAIHLETNALRESYGLPAYAYDTTLAQNAATYSVTMITDDFIGHTDSLGCNMTCRFMRDAYEAHAWGENLASWQSSYEPTVSEVAAYFVREWEKSDGHRDNLLSYTFTHEGIGVARDGNSISVTVHFADPK